MFQKSVLKKHIRSLDKFLLNSAYDKFLKIFSRKRINEIVKLKEEEYAEGFLRDLFVKVLGYKLKPDENFNLVREMKNPTNSKKTDAAILKNGNAIAVIELKSTKTKDLTKVTEQAFNYKNNHPFCKYVITSNFQKLRFYVEHSNEYQEFNLFACKKTDFELLYLILNKENIFIDIPQKLKEETKFHEEKISKKFYKDYSNLKNEIFENLILRNKKIDKLTLFKKSQKLLNRLIFIFFAEDYGLMPPNSIFEIIDKYKKLIQLDEYKKLYEIYKEYFNYINTGREGKFYANNIPAYNGGLFAKDKILDNLKIDDKILKNEVLKLASYDFSTELDVNILGHIFEHSLNEIEEMEKKINLQGFKNLEGLKTSKRKKDGVFYTPKYITQYIVENTIGTLCTEKRKEMNIYEIEFDNSYNTKRGRLNKKGKALFITFNNYKKWLESLKILDPACGSGAFLNQALQFLIKEHKFIDDLTAELTKQKIRLFDTDKNILENNLYGVDINDESVEIAKLSLWLRTAKKGRKLSNLNKNIKCGNSLIDDKKIEKEKAFNWNIEFKEIMKNGGFDIVIGNPPYFNIQTLGRKSKIAQSIQDNYPEIWQDKSDIIFYFIAKAIELSKNKISFIVSNAFLFSDKAKKLRNFILDNTNFTKITNFERYMVFEDALITTAIIELDKNKSKKKTLAYSFKNKKYKQEEISSFLNLDKNYFSVNFEKNKVFALVNNKISKINEKIDNNYPKIKDIIKIGKGMETAANKVFIFNNYPFQFPKEFIKKRMSGEIIKKYGIENLKEYILYFENIENFDELTKSIQNHLLKNKKFLENRADKKRRKTAKWWNYTFPMHKNFYHLDKIFCSYRAKENIFCFDDSNEYIGLTNTTVIFDTNENINLKYLLTCLNSKVLNFRYKSIGKQTGSGVFEYVPNAVEKLPIPEISKEKQKPFIEKSDKMISLHKKLEFEKHNFLKTLQEEKGIIKLTKKLQNFQLLKYDEFKNNLRKQKIKIKLGSENNEWREYFEKTKEKINHLQIQIDKTDKIIDKMVYKLYKLNEEEIKIICEN